MRVEKKNQIVRIVNDSVGEFASRFRRKHLSEVDNPDGVINQKVHNVFLEALGKETMFFNALSRSLDSSLGNMVEDMAIKIASLEFDVSQELEGKIFTDQTRAIGVLLEKYKNSNDSTRPNVAHAREIATKNHGSGHTKRHDSDYVLRHKSSGDYFLIELKLGGDLDNKKARSEKEALLEQYCLLVNKLGSAKKVRIYFATAYNRFGEGNPWAQGRVRQFFADEELLISKDFWNFVADDQEGYRVVIEEYAKSASLIANAIDDVKSAYL